MSLAHCFLSRLNVVPRREADRDSRGDPRYELCRTRPASSSTGCGRGTRTPSANCSNCTANACGGCSTSASTAGWARRVSPDDVLQEAFLDVARRIGEYLADPAVPFYVWLRFLTVQRMQMVQRAHLGAQMRDVGLEVGWRRRRAASSESMAGQLVGDLTSPSQAAIRRELQDRLRAALDEMDPLDREVLALRHFEELSNDEVAEVLGISKDAASKRYVRALKRLRRRFCEAMNVCPMTDATGR